MPTKNILQYLWMIFLFIILSGLLIWAIWCIEDTKTKISIFSIVVVILAAFTSVLTVSINNKKAKEREYDLLVIKEKQKVFEHFYNAFFESISQSRKKGTNQLPKKTVEEMMNFKRGLMNWGSERLIKKYIEYENKMVENRETFDLLKDGDEFLKEIRKEMGYQVSNNVNLISIILTAEARQELNLKTK
jgi:flagellar motor component MotA